MQEKMLQKRNCIKGKNEEAKASRTLALPADIAVTPEATVSVADKLMPGFGELMRQVSLDAVPTAILSRQTAVIRSSALIVNLRGQPKAIRECLDAVFPAIPYGIDLIGGPGYR